MGDEQMVTRVEAARMLRCSVETVKRRERAKKITGHSTGPRAKTLYRRADVEALMAAKAADEAATEGEVSDA